MIMVGPRLQETGKCNMNLRPIFSQPRAIMEFMIYFILFNASEKCAQKLQGDNEEERV